MNYQFILSNLTSENIKSCVICNSNLKYLNSYFCENKNCLAEYYFISRNLHSLSFKENKYLIIFFPNKENYEIVENSIHIRFPCYIIFPFSQCNNIITKHVNGQLSNYIDKNINNWKLLL